MQLGLFLFCALFLYGILQEAFAYSYQTDSLAVRAILDSNGLTNVAVDSVSNSELGRIVKLSLTGKHLDTIPEIIGQLNALNMLLINSNELHNLPLSLASLHCAIDVNYNHLCHVTDSLSHWLDKHQLCDMLCLNWFLYQNCSTLTAHKSCSTMRFPLPVWLFSGNSSFVHFIASNPDSKLMLEIYNLNGRCEQTIQGRGEAILNLARNSKQVRVAKIRIDGFPRSIQVSIPSRYK
jgi:hypothetical protein